MGDFAAPAAAANGSSICINNNLNSSLGGAGIGVNSTPHGPPAAAPGNNNANSGGGGIPKHSTVVERLRQRIEGCRRHHVNCESRYQQAQAEQLELERRDTVSLYQRTLEQRAKKTGTGTGGSKQQQQHQSKQQQDAEPATAEQRNHTLIMVRGCGAGVCVCVSLSAPESLRRDEPEGSPPLFSGGGDGTGRTEKARLNFGGGRAAGQLGERGGGAWLPAGFATSHGQGRGERTNFFSPVSFRRDEVPRGGGTEREGAVPGVGCRKPEEGFNVACVFREGFFHAGEWGRAPWLGGLSESRRGGGWKPVPQGSG